MQNNDLQYIEEERQARLNQARFLEEQERLRKSAIAVEIAEKLEEQIAKDSERGTIFLALLVAVFKDLILDFALNFLYIGLIPVIGQIPGAMASGALFFLMRGKGMLEGKMKARVLVGLIVDVFPIGEEFPITTFAVVLAWRNLAKKVKAMKAEREKLANMTDDEIKEVERKFEL